MGKRIFLFLITNLAFMLLFGTIIFLLSMYGVLPTRGSGYLVASAIVSIIWGMGGAFLSLAISRWVAKRFGGVELIDENSGNKKLRAVYGMVGQYAKQARIPMPEVGYYDSDEVNAFATGPSKKRSLVAVSTGLLDVMKQSEVEGVIAHEVAHIANGDMVTMTLLQGVINAFVLFFARVIAWAVRQALDSNLAWLVSFIVYWVMIIVLGLLGSMITSWFSRKREFSADAGGAEYAGREKMIAALRRLQSTVELVDTKTSPALNSMKISGGSRFMALFSTHPALEKRIARLEGRQR